MMKIVGMNPAEAKAMKGLIQGEEGKDILENIAFMIEWEWDNDEIMVFTEDVFACEVSRNIIASRKTGNG